jgi:predicted GNAT family acetyltransferase
LVEKLTGARHIPGARTSIVYATKNGDLTVQSRYKTLAGEASVIVRTFRTARDGKREVYHALFEIDDKLQGRGIAKAVLREQIQEYRRMGIERITLSAAWTGRYTWTRMGFAYAGDESMLQAARLAFRRHLESELGKKVAGNVMQHITDLRSIALTEVNGRQLGKEFLKGYNDNVMFPMRLNLDPSDPNYQLVVHYLAL